MRGLYNRASYDNIDPFLMRIATKLALLLLVVSLLPLTLFGLVSLRQVRKATVISVTEGNLNVSRRAAEQIEQYVKNALAILESTAENISHADLQDWQKERILKNYGNRFDEFNHLSIRDVDGRLTVTSRLAGAEMTSYEAGAFQGALQGRESRSFVFIREDLTPAMAVAVPIRRLTKIDSILVAELNLMQMWYLVDGIRIGQRGILHVLDKDDRLIATGDGERKRDVFQEKAFEPAALLPKILEPGGEVFRNPPGVEVAAVGTRLKAPLEWTVIVEQPTSEAYALATRLSTLLFAAMGTMILIAILSGVWGGRRQVVDPIHELTRATEELARGNLAHRVALRTGDEFSLLGDAFNQMAIRLKELQEKLVLEERHAVFGRIASGLAHDLKHPFQAIQNVSRLMDPMHDDPGFRKTFRRTIEREFEKISGFLQNLHNLTHEIPYQPLPISLPAVLRDVLETFELEAKKNGIGIAIEMPPEDARDVRIWADRTSLNRVFSNLVSNALQAMPEGGRLKVSVTDGATVEIVDTGVGIPPERIPTLFDDFVTTKGRGLGLGLAIVRKIIHQHGGTITVTSRVGQGTSFVVKLPCRS